MKNTSENYFDVGKNCTLDDGSVVGYRYRDHCGPARVASNGRIRRGTIIYADVRAGEFFQTGHNVTIREHTIIGDHVVVGTNTVIEGQVRIGDFVKIESNCFIPTHSVIGSRVFLGPNVVLTNDKYPLRQRERYRPQGVVIEDNVTLGAGVIVLPGITIGEGSFVAAGCVVIKDVPSGVLVRGNPGACSSLPERLREKKYGSQLDEISG